MSGGIPMRRPEFGDDGQQSIYTPREAAEHLRCSRDLVYELCASGQLKSFKLGRARRITRAALDEFVAGLESEAAS